MTSAYDEAGVTAQDVFRESPVCIPALISALISVLMCLYRAADLEGEREI